MSGGKISLWEGADQSVKKKENEQSILKENMPSGAVPG